MEERDISRDTRHFSEIEGITLDTKISDLLNDYDDMKNILIRINPKFEKLNNPLLRRTLGRVASIRQAAIVGGMNPVDLVDRLRISVGQDPVCEDCEIKSDECFYSQNKTSRPDWTKQKSVYSFDANKLLESNINPLAEVRKALRQLDKGEVLTLTADFKPEPLIEEFHKDGCETYTYQDGETRFVTFIKPH